MLTEHEEKLIQRYYIYPKIAITAVIMALALGAPFILLEMIDDLVFTMKKSSFGAFMSIWASRPCISSFSVTAPFEPSWECGKRNGRSCSAVSRSVSSSPIIPQLPRAPWPWGLPAA